MSRGTILGYEIASPEKQRKTALIILAVVVFILGGACAAFVGPTVYKTWTYHQVTGRVKAIEEKCTYSIRRLSRYGNRLSLTDLVNCEEAYAKAAEIDHAMGDVRHFSIVYVTYTPAGGTAMTSSFDVPAEAARDLRIGQSLVVMHHPDHPYRVERVPTNAFALTHEARYAGNVAAASASAPAVTEQETGPQASTPTPAPRSTAPAPARKKFELAKPGEEPSTIEKVSRVIAWIIVALIGVAIIAVPWLLWRLAKRFFGGAATPISPPRPRSAPSANRMASVSRPRAASASRQPRITAPR